MNKSYVILESIGDYTFVILSIVAAVAIVAYVWMKAGSREKNR